MDASDVPTWVQSIGALFGTAGTVAWLTWNERKKKKALPAVAEGEATVLSASMVDSRAVKTLVDVVSELKAEIRDSKELRHNDSRSERDCMDSLTRALRENTDARHNPGITPDLAVLLARMGDKG